LFNKNTKKKKRSANPSSGFVACHATGQNENYVLKRNKYKHIPNEERKEEEEKSNKLFFFFCF